MGTEQQKKESLRRKKKPYTGLCHEIAAIAAIIGDAFLKQIHAQIDGGMFDALEIVSDASVAFYKEFQKAIENKGTNWEEICGQQGVPGYDDLIIRHAAKYIIDKHNIKLKL